ncbi:hypothetical protein KSS87_019843 [Heliosperma pusillum]|nr:hypothetical protein KSS87_019843 [Heliosperma pusillum]
MARSTSKDAQALFHSLRSAYTATPTNLKIIDVYIIFAVSTALIQVDHERLIRTPVAGRREDSPPTNPPPLTTKTYTTPTIVPCLTSNSGSKPPFSLSFAFSNHQIPLLQTMKYELLFILSNTLIYLKTIGSNLMLCLAIAYRHDICHFLSSYAVNPLDNLVAYMATVGSFPFNSFLSGVLSCVGTAVLAVCLRVQVNKENKEFKDLAPERAFADFVLCNLVLHLVIMNFLG